MIRNQGFFYGAEGFYGYGNKLNTDYIADDESHSPSSFGLKASANWFLNYHFSAGIGAGILSYQEPEMLTFPILLNTQAYLSEGSNTPLVYVEGGYGFRFNHRKQDKGFLYECGLGYRYRVKWKSSLVLKVGYRHFSNPEWLWRRKQEEPLDLTDPYRWYSLDRQSITVSIGFYYSTRY